MFNIGKKSIRALNPFANHEEAPKTDSIRKRKKVVPSNTANKVSPLLSEEEKTEMDFFLNIAKGKFDSLLNSLRSINKRAQYEQIFLNELQSILNYVSESLVFLKVQNFQSKLIELIPRNWKVELEFPSQLYDNKSLKNICIQHEVN
jgi:hypothetical protein